MGSSKVRWLLPGAVGLATFYVGGRIEVASIDAGDGFAHGRAGVAHAVALLFIGLAVDQYRRWRRTQPPAAHGAWRVPAWQGYGAIAVGAGFVGLACAMWSLTELKSITLVLTFVIAGALSAVLGVAVVRAAPTDEPTASPRRECR